MMQSENTREYELMIRHSPVAMGLLKGESLEIAVANEKLLTIWRKNSSIIGKPLLSVLPEARERVADSQLLGVLTSGVPFTGMAGSKMIEDDSSEKEHWFNFIYSPLGNGLVMITAVDVTEQEESKKILLENESRLKDVIAVAPAAMGLFVGRDLVVQIPNQAFIDIVGKGPDIVGKPLREVMPELLTENQPFLNILDDVYTSGKMFQSFGSRVDIVQNGTMTNNYYNITYTPVFDKNGEVYAILDIAIDVTGEVALRQRLQETESFLRNAINVAQLGTWSLEIATSNVYYSDKIREWFGLNPDEEILPDIVESIAPEDRERIKEAINKAISPDFKGIYDEEYTVINRNTGRRKLVRAQGKLLIDEAGTPSRFIGIARDVTMENSLWMELEHQIQTRTEELASAAEELRVTNEDLFHSNEKLTRSNEDLQRFAHVASHDLKEPLRKIKTFLSRIELNKDSMVSEKAISYFERIDAAADRMEDMISGVLNYSTVNGHHQPIQKIDIKEVCESVMLDLELIIVRTNAIIKIEEMPVIEGAKVLIHQLFYNLLSNSLKFIKEKKIPVIEIESKRIIKNDVAYTEISVSDNGIGFEQEFAGEIFDTFIRLNTKDNYEGTGLGLSLCRRIVERHHGTIKAEGDLHKGAKFIITLPLEQNQEFI